MLINPLEIIQKTEQAYYLEPGTIVSYNRSRMVSEARAVAVYLTKKLTPYNWSELGEKFNRDHSSIIMNFRKIEQMQNKSVNNHANCVIIDLINQFKGVQHERAI